MSNQPTNQPTKITIYSRVLFVELLVPANSLPSQKIPHIMWNPKLHQHVHSSLPLVPILSQMNPVHALPSYYLLNTSVILTIQLSPWKKVKSHSYITKPTDCYFLKIHINIILQLCPDLHRGPIPSVFTAIKFVKQSTG